MIRSVTYVGESDRYCRLKVSFDNGQTVIMCISLEQTASQTVQAVAEMMMTSLRRIEEGKLP